jgi:hypothetical protein
MVTYPKIFIPDNVTLELSPEGLARVKDLGITPEKLSFGTWQKIVDITVSSDVTAIDITNLDINNDKAYILLYSSPNPTGSASNIYIFIEGNYTVTSYYSQYLNAGGTSVSAGRDNNPTFCIVPAYYGTSCIAFIMRTSDGRFKCYSIFGPNPGASIDINFRSVSTPGTVSNITQIRIASSITNGIFANARILLFKVSTQ